MAKTYQVVVTRTARTAIKSILDYLKENASLEVAHQVRQGINETIRSLETIPARNPIAHELSTEQIVYRKILKWSYKIIYTIEEATIQVIVVDVTHTKQNPQSLIEKFKK